MKSITIRKVPEPVHRNLRVRAAKNGRSLESEIRAIFVALSRPRRGASNPPSAPRQSSALDPASAAPVLIEMPLNEEDISIGAGPALKKVRSILRREAEDALEQA